MASLAAVTLVGVMSRSAGASVAPVATAAVRASSGPSCTHSAYSGENGAVATTFAQGFPTGAAETNPCVGIMGITFDSGGNVFLSDQFDGNLYHFSPTGGSAGPASYLGHALGVAAYEVIFAPGGDLYGVASQTNGNIAAGGVVQLNPQTGRVVRLVTDKLMLPTWIAVDPLTGDLFVTGGGTGAYFSPDLWRIQNPSSADPADPPKVTVYATSSVGFTQLVVAPNGTIYAITRANHLVSLGGTNTPQPAHFTTLASIPATANGGLVLGPLGGNGVPTSIYTASNNLDRVDLPSGKVTKLLVGHPGGTIDIQMGPDGCLYMADTDRILRVSGVDGVCTFDGSPSDVASYVPTPGQVSWSIRSVAQSWFWVALLIVLLGAASTLFNATLDANYAEIRSALSRQRRRFTRKAAPDDKIPEPATWRGWRALTVYLLLAGVVDSVGYPSIGTFADFGVGIGVGSVVGMEVTRRRVANRRGKIGQPMAHPWTLLIAGAFLGISVLASARPGYVFGIVISMAFVPALEEGESGAYAAFGALLALGIGVTAWFLRWPLAYGLGAHPDVFHRFVSDVLAIIFVSSVFSVAFGMAPLRFLPGEVVRSWHKGAWIALWALGLFGVVHILESGYGYASTTQERAPTFIFGIVLLAFAAAFWAYFRRKGENDPPDPRPEASAPTEETATSVDSVAAAATATAATTPLEPVNKGATGLEGDK